MNKGISEGLIEGVKKSMIQIERLGTGTADMVRIAKENKLREPVFEQLEDFKRNGNLPTCQSRGFVRVPPKHPSTFP